MINRVLIGFDERQQISFTALQQSIIARTSKPVAIIPIVLRTLPITRAGLTPFTFSRFLTPWLCDYQGWGLFMDVDMLLRDDITRLFEMADDRYAVMVADTYDRFERASLMLFNCAHPSNQRLTPEFVESTSATTNLHALEWLSEDEIGFFPREWNHTVGIDAPNPDAKLIHYTMGTPAHEEIHGCEFTEPWIDAIDAATSTQSWSSLMGNSTWAMELSDGRKLPRLHPEARREAEAILEEIAAIRGTGNSADSPSAGYADRLEGLNQAVGEGETSKTFSFETAPAARMLMPHLGPLRHLCMTTKAKTLLDYGTSRQGFYDARGITFPDGNQVESIRALWQLDAPVASYVPGRDPRNDVSGSQFDAVLCAGFLERVPLEDIVWQVEDLFARAKKFVYVVVAGFEAKESLPDGHNLHATVRRKTWWEVLFREIGADFPDTRYFVIVNQPVKTKDGKTAIESAFFQA